MKNNIQVLEKVYELLIEKGVFKSNSIITLLSLPNEELKSRIKKDRIESNEIILYASNQGLDVPIGKAFDYVISRENFPKSIKVRSTLEYISVNPHYEVSCLPDGYSGACLFKFDDKLPKELDKLCDYSLKYDPLINDFLLVVNEELESSIREYATQIII